VAGPRVRVLTLNCLWHGAASERLVAIARTLEPRPHDFVCLQEVIRPWTVAILNREAASYRQAIFARRRLLVRGGLVSLTPHRAERNSSEVFRGRGPNWTLAWADRLLGKGFLTTWLNINGIPAAVVNTHLVANYDEEWSSGNRFVREQRRDLLQLAAAIDRLERHRLVIVAGDLNVRGDMALMREFMERCDLKSAAATSRSLDHVLYRLPPGSQARVNAGELYRGPVRLPSGRVTRLSDHFGVEAEIELI
jgi:endonuclease/exonuclease/phosphatase family metal-dependent hydrolase